MNSLGMLEFKSVAAGILACDACLKAAEVELIYSQPVCAGKYMIALKGDVGDVKSSIEAGENAVKELLISSIVIPNLHEGIFSAINATSDIKEVKALGIVESFSVAEAVISADYALKAADIEMIELRLAKGLGGKAYFSFTGEVGAVRESEKVAREFLAEKGMLVYSTVIPGPHKDLAEKVF